LGRVSWIPWFSRLGDRPRRQAQLAGRSLGPQSLRKFQLLAGASLQRKRPH
jgi:hypothetical protein